MAPKRVPKVTCLSPPSAADPSTSAGRGRNANPSRPRDPNSYDDYDEAMQDGVELEEKGERFQFGPKAQRSYVQAGTLYDRAAYLAGANVGRRADALFNASRVHFLLASQFELPPQNLQSLVEAITTAQEAVRLAPPLSAAGLQEGFLPNPFTLDAMTHLATSLQTLAEAVEELGWPQGLQAPRLASRSASQPPTTIQLWQEALSLFQLIADGQNVILQDQKLADDTTQMSAEATTEKAQDEDMGDSEQGDASQGEMYGYTASLVTPASLMETLLSVLACLTSLIEASSAIEQVQNYDTAGEQIAFKGQRLASEQEAAVLQATSNNSSQASSETAARWEEIRRSSLTLRIASIAKVLDLGSAPEKLSSELEAAMRTVDDWASRLVATEGVGVRKNTSVATLCDVGEAGQSLCRLSLRLSPPEEGVAAIWTLATISTKLFSQALAALDTTAVGGGSAAVLGQANTSTPTSRARCRILLALSNLSIFRSHPAFEAAGIAGAKGTRIKLVDNARLYARKAVSEIGLGSLLRPAPAQTPRSPVLPPPGGWESLSLESEATFHLLRSLLVRANVNAAEAVDSKAIAEMENELINLAVHVVQLRSRPIQVGSTPSSGSVHLSDWLYVQGAKSFVDSVMDENGRNIVSEEIVWWERLFSNQLAG
ncbi:uncharacterized protein MEPE_00904 [Melanopsichium pennsylvanicum]|uniref:Uncharacterized protein n=2 Tax=Melanopsichium pennsylvanicum TaxID=63383 RepID=A0AAJ5C357_9BASI|nr:conserved hypothetical protein [Melanopsichium pennsylvanicum 4]SNX82198.1 uncharacterized protein MEPE_00904 [Melanopsichium pennsylvanicum]